MQSSADSSSHRLRPLILLAALLFASTAVGGGTPSRSVDDLARSADDLERDKTSQPVETLAFLGLEPGMRVLDVFAGDGYYSEVIAGVVGNTGHVYLHNNLGSSKALARMQKRLSGGRLPNVEALVQDLDQLLIPAQSLDLVLLVKVFHDFYYQNNGWNVAPDPALRVLFRLLKPGGTFGIIDHVAVSGSGSAAAQILHRVDPVFVCTEMTRMGFVFEGASDLLNNSQDPLDVPVFQTEVRGNTARFVHRYRRPAADEGTTQSTDCDRLGGS